MKEGFEQFVLTGDFYAVDMSDNIYSTLSTAARGIFSWFTERHASE